MPTDINIPELGEGIDGGDVTAISVAVGDHVTEDQALIEMETGKATLDIPSPVAGTIVEILVAEGDKKLVGDPIVRIETGAAAAEAPAAAEAVPEAAPAEEEATEPPEATPAPATTAPSEIDLVIPNLGEGVDEGEVKEILVSVGEEIREDQGLIEMETGKATVDIPSPANGTITAITVAPGETKKPGDVIGRMMAEGSVVPAAPAASTPAAAAPAPASTPKPAPAGPKLQAAKRADHVPVPAAPSIRKFAREIGVTIREVPGTGPRGRISLDDVKRWSKQVHESSGSSAGGLNISAPALPDFSVFGTIRKEEMSTIRRMTVDHMATCWATIPHVTQFDFADQTDLEVLRKRFQPRAEAAGAKLTVTAMLIKVLGSALKVFPNFNASIDTANETVIYKDYFNVGCAVDTPKGLLVPVIRDVDSKNMIEIAAELGAIAGKMRDGKIHPKELQGGCISLSNLGGLTGKHFTPIINGPEVAILGVGRGEMKPTWDGEKFVPRLMMPLSLSYDHRLIDGADGTRFLRWIVDAIEQPLLISLEG